MQIQARAATFSSRQVAFVIALFAVAAIILLALVSQKPAYVSPAGGAVSKPSVAILQDPDMLDRNAQLIQAQTARWSNLSPDAQERNEQLAH